MTTIPLVSVILATYNRSRVLAHAIQSVRCSTLTDWELIVVGDHCTDDTAAVVAGFADPRVTFVNLPENVGEQSGPNNEGVRRARGRYLAFLNHDDLYFPDHLATAVAACEDLSADLVWSPLLVPLPVPAQDLERGRWRVRLSGVPIDDHYDPRLFVFASAWLLTRELAARIGPWRPARETFVSSSQDWLWRAWQAGARMRVTPRATVMAIPGSMRRDSYTAAVSPEHEVFAARMHTDLGFRERMLELAAFEGERAANRVRFGRSWLDAMRGLLFRPIGAVAMALGTHPYAPYLALRHGRRGNLVSAIRRQSGLGGLKQG